MVRTDWNNFQQLKQRVSGVVRHMGRGLCESCYNRAYHQFQLIDYQPSIRAVAETYCDWLELRAQGLTRRLAAERMRIPLNTLERAIARHKRRVGLPMGPGTP